MSEVSGPYVHCFKPENLDDPLVAEYAHKLTVCNELRQGGKVKFFKFCSNSDSAKNKVCLEGATWLGSNGKLLPGQSSCSSIPLGMMRFKPKGNLAKSAEGDTVIDAYSLHASQLKLQLPVWNEFVLHQIQIEEPGQADKVTKDVFIRHKLEATCSVSQDIKNALNAIRDYAYSIPYSYRSDHDRYSMLLTGHFNFDPKLEIPIVGSEGLSIGSANMRLHYPGTNTTIAHTVRGLPTIWASMSVKSELIWGDEISQLYQEEMSRPRLYIPIPLQEDHSTFALDRNEEGNVRSTLTPDWVFGMALLSVRDTFKQGKADVYMSQGSKAHTFNDIFDDDTSQDISVISDDSSDSTQYHYHKWGAKLYGQTKHPLEVSLVEDGVRTGTAKLHAMLCGHILVGASQEAQILSAFGSSCCEPTSDASNRDIEGLEATDADWASAQRVQNLEVQYNPEMELTTNITDRYYHSAVKRYFQIEPASLDLAEGGYVWQEATYSKQHQVGDTMYFDAGVGRWMENTDNDSSLVLSSEPNLKGEIVDKQCFEAWDIFFSIADVATYQAEERPADLLRKYGPNSMVCDGWSCGSQD